MPQTRPRLALVMGEPAGIGPELCVRVLQQPQAADIRVYGDMRMLQRAADALRLPMPAALQMVDIALPVLPDWGLPNPANAHAVINALQAAADACLHGHCDGLVTAPIHKACINAGGIAYTGTTEVLAQHAGSDVVMMLANATMKVALATTHLPLRSVADAITPALLRRVLRILHRSLQQRFAIPHPHITVLGLNPHAGEDGVLGDEETRIITPLLQQLRAEGMRLAGPVPADSAFLPQKLTGTDAILAMYHDQGLPVLKFSDFDHATNITLGLPYPRVAVDHGTALDLAGKGSASAASLQAAITECARQVRAMSESSLDGQR